MTLQQTFIVMVLMHLVADYTLQGWLASGKQVSWWRDLVKDSKWPKYRHDYIVALVCHSLYWSILVCLPLFSCWFFAAVVAANTAVHAVVDDLKANRGKLNLVQDQAMHLAQIVATMAVAAFLKGV